MKKANAIQQSTKAAVKAKEEITLLSILPALKIKREPQATAAVVMSVLNVSADDEDRIYKCEQPGCFSSFKSRSSLRDHQKGLSLEIFKQAKHNLSLIIVHSDDRPYACAFCSSAFKSSSNRSKHERGSHTEQYQRRKMLREGLRNGEVEEDETTTSPPAKKIKITLVQSPKVIKQEPAASPKKATNEFPCRYCDRVLKRADNRDKHEATHKDIRAFGELLEVALVEIV